jgi:hypothetical protein
VKYTRSRLDSTDGSVGSEEWLRIVQSCVLECFGGSLVFADVFVKNGISVNHASLREAIRSKTWPGPLPASPLTEEQLNTLMGRKRKRLHKLLFHENAPACSSSAAPVGSRLLPKRARKSLL